MTARCDDDFEIDPRTGLGIGCARCQAGGKPLPKEQPGDPLEATGPETEARYATTCAACRKWIEPGECIRSTAAGWAHSECTREPA